MSLLAIVALLHLTLEEWMLGVETPSVIRIRLSATKIGIRVRWETTITIRIIMCSTKATAVWWATTASRLKTRFVRLITLFIKWIIFHTFRHLFSGDTWSFLFNISCLFVKYQTWRFSFISDLSKLSFSRIRATQLINLNKSFWKDFKLSPDRLSHKRKWSTFLLRNRR